MIAVGDNDSVIVWKPDLDPSSTSNTIPNNAIRIENNDENKTSSVSWNHQNASILAVGYSSGEIIVWDCNSQEPITSYCDHEQRVGSLDWLGPLLTSGSRDKRIVTRDLRCPDRDAFVWDYHKQEVCGVSWSPEGCGLDGVLASGGNDNLLLIWKLGYKQPILVLKEHIAAVKAIAWSPFHAGFLATGGGTNDRSVRLWDIKVSDESHSSNVKSFTDTGSQICNIMWSKTTQQLLTTHGFTYNQIIIWNITHPNATSFHVEDFTLKKDNVYEGHSSRILYLAMNNAGDYVATAAGDETLRFWNFFPPASRRYINFTDHMGSGKFLWNFI